jgi:hypothetical protein
MTQDAGIGYAWTGNVGTILLRLKMRAARCALRPPPQKKL